eukprot:GEMP01051268.1.p1 GENE.GEMP01051268.1~~GEMP01051268.1.p1  ORF type:complete len:129 (-),score=14.68 GEMP01051268.1:378-764(-)
MFRLLPPSKNAAGHLLLLSVRLLFHMRLNRHRDTAHLDSFVVIVFSYCSEYDIAGSLRMKCHDRTAHGGVLLHVHVLSAALIRITSGANCTLAAKWVPSFQLNHTTKGYIGVRKVSGNPFFPAIEVNN